ncbi:unnamed protein product [Alternaria alternata]
MAAQVEPEIVLYDLACTKGVCFSPAVWRIRLMLNYKRIPYKTIFIEFPDIEPTLKGLILSPRSQEYFRRTREAAMGCKLEELLDSEKEELAWRKVEDDIRTVEQLLLTNEKEGQFVLGARPSATDFFLAGSLHAARTVDESVFARIANYPGFKKIYEACVPYMQGQEVPDLTN